MTRTLALKRETLTELTHDELAGVLAARNTPSCPLVLRLSELLDCH